MTINRVLVTGARLPAALELIRAFHKAGVEVWAADSLRLTTGGISRYTKGYIQFPSPGLLFDDFKTSICEAVQRLHIDLIVPVSEEIFYLAQIRDGLAPAKLFAPAMDDLRKMHSKWDILPMATDCNIRLPETIKVSSAAELRMALQKIPHSVIKPEYSRGAYDARFPPHEAIETIDVSAVRPWLVQEKLSGKEISTYCIAYEGHVLAQTCYEPLYRVGPGASLYFRPHSSQIAVRFVESFIRNNHLTGQFSFDLMQENEQSLALIECNPRATSGVHLLNPDNQWACAFWGEKPTATGTENVRACAAKLAVAMFHVFSPTRNGQEKSLMQDLRDARDSTFRLEDPLPFFALQLTAIEILWRSRSWHVPPQQAFTFDVEWNGDPL